MVFVHFGFYYDTFNIGQEFKCLFDYDLTFKILRLFIIPEIGQVFEYKKCTTKGTCQIGALDHATYVCMHYYVH